MAEAENKLEREDAGEESMVIESTVNGSPQATVTKHAQIARVTKEAVEDEIGVVDEEKNNNIPTKEDGKTKSTVKRGNLRKRQDRKKSKAAGNDGDADPSRSALVKVEENASTVINGSNEDKVGEEGGDNGGKEVSDKDNDGKVETPTTSTALAVATASAALTSETAKDNDGKEVSDKAKVDSTLSKKKRERKKRNHARVTGEEAAGNAEIGAVKKLSDTKGMIFMCSSKTKKECYRYKIFGMPAGRKEMVAKVYKGMKLFLFDIDVKLLYGIYVATSKGGFDIQPKAFNSAFPSQVRFKVLKEYSPLSQEKFKAAIRSNYYKKNMFSCELSAEQVQKLTKLFVEATKSSKPTISRVAGKRVSESIVSHETKRRQYKGPGDHMLPRSHDRYERDAYASQQPVQAPFPLHGSAVSRHAPLPLYPSPPRVAALPPPPPAYAYERPGDMDVDYYRRELEARGFKVVEPERRPLLDRVAYNDPYSLYGEPASYPETRPTSILPSGYYGSALPPYRY